LTYVGKVLIASRAGGGLYLINRNLRLGEDHVREYGGPHAEEKADSALQALGRRLRKKKGPLIPGGGDPPFFQGGRGVFQRGVQEDGEGIRRNLKGVVVFTKRADNDPRKVASMEFREKDLPQKIKTWGGVHRKKEIYGPCLNSTRGGENDAGRRMDMGSRNYPFNNRKRGGHNGRKVNFQGKEGVVERKGNAPVWGKEARRGDEGTSTGDKGCSLNLFFSREGGDPLSKI